MPKLMGMNKRTGRLMDDTIMFIDHIKNFLLLLHEIFLAVKRPQGKNTVNNFYRKTCKKHLTSDAVSCRKTPMMTAFRSPWKFVVVATLALGMTTWGQDDASKDMTGDSEKEKVEMEIKPLTANFIKFIQTPKLVIDTDDERTLNLQPSEAYLQRNDKWLRIEFAYRLRTKREFVDDVQFKIYVEGQAKEKKTDRNGDAIILTGEATYAHVRVSDSGSSPKDRFAVFFIHPDMVKKYGDETFFSNTANIELEGYVAGKKLDALNKKGEKEGWFNDLKKVDGVVLTRDRSPWACLQMDRYPALKQSPSK